MANALTHTCIHILNTGVLLQSVPDSSEGPNLAFVSVLALVLVRLQHVNVKRSPIMTPLMVCVTPDPVSL